MRRHVSFGSTWYVMRWRLPHFSQSLAAMHAPVEGRERQFALVALNGVVTPTAPNG
jgi:hypothetical protein